MKSQLPSIRGKSYLHPYNLSMGEGNGTQLQYSCPENPMDGGAWQAAVHGVAKSRPRLSNFTFTFMHWRRKWQPTPVLLPGESQGRGSLVSCRLWGRTESDTTEATQQQQQQPFYGVDVSFHNSITSTNDLTIIVTVESPFSNEQIYE